MCVAAWNPLVYTCAATYTYVYIFVIYLYGVYIGVHYYSLWIRGNACDTGKKTFPVISYDGCALAIVYVTALFASNRVRVCNQVGTCTVVVVINATAVECSPTGAPVCCLNVNVIAPMIVCSICPSHAQRRTFSISSRCDKDHEWVLIWIRR
jgi:hypothetical protein